jgi:hypothetical protein
MPKKREDIIWLGPGVLNPAKKSKSLKPLHPGEPVPAGFVSDDRLSAAIKKGKAVSKADYAKGQAASGKAPGKNTAQLKELTDKVEELTKANGDLTKANEELVEAGKGGK